jgi:hypothetical protein
MPLAPNDDGWGQVERLVAELRAIERWNADYWGNSDPETYETLAFVARRERRAEILSQLPTLIPPLVKKSRETYLDRRNNRVGGQKKVVVHD